MGLNRGHLRERDCSVNFSQDRVQLESICTTRLFLKNSMINPRFEHFRDCDSFVQMLVLSMFSALFNASLVVTASLGNYPLEGYQRNISCFVHLDQISKSPDRIESHTLNWYRIDPHNQSVNNKFAS